VQVVSGFGWQALAPTDQSGLAPWWLQVRKSIARARRKAFDSVVVLVVWSVWLERNEHVFRDERKQPSQVAASILAELHNWCDAKLVDRSSLSGM
jgi:hypothetical protein